MKWLKKNIVSKYLMTNCPEKTRCVDLLHRILDGAAEKDEEQYFMDHIEECWGCFQDYKLEHAIRELVKTKLEKKAVPEDLVSSIRQRIDESA